MLPGYQPRTHAAEDELEMAARLINEAERPIILAGHGIMMSGATDELLHLVEVSGVPVALDAAGEGARCRKPPLVAGHDGHAWFGHLKFFHPER